jgi:hypothetical protein
MGHTYGGNGIWQFNQPGIPHGASPHGGNYGNTPWQEAMHFSGSTHCALGKKLLLRFPWEKFEPHPEWAAYTSKVWIPLDGAQWIWPNRDVPAKDAPARRAYFRRTFEIPAGRKILSARLRFAGTVHCEAQLNGATAGVGFDWRTGPQFNDRAQLLQPGRNVLTLWCEHRPPTGDTPGLLACLEIRYAGGRVQRIVTDGSWKTWGSKIGGWESRAFDDTAWPVAIVVGQLGDQPWGPINSPDLSLHGPQSAGIPGKLRITYVPHAEPIVMRGLGANTAWRATCFDPPTGKEKKLGRIIAGTDGTGSCPPPAGSDHDWILILEA